MAARHAGLQFSRLFTCRRGVQFAPRQPGYRPDIAQQPGQNRSEAVSRAAAAAGATILLLRPIEHSLEDVFFELTQKAALEEGESK